MTFNATFALNVLLPLSSAAYSIPITKGVMPTEYTLVAPILVDGTAIQARRGLRKLINGTQFGWVALDTASKTLVVAYRGTDDLADCLKDISGEDEPYRCVKDYGRVHAGFQHVYFAVRDSVIAACNKARDSYNRILLTGHSLGAAVSELSAPDIYYQHLGCPEVINFAAPRVGKADFVEKFDRDIPVCVRIVNRWDAVPRVPSLWTGYRHPGEAITFSSSFTCNLLKAHSLDGSYFPGVESLCK